MLRRLKQSRPPSVEEYVSGLTAIAPRMNATQHNLLVAQYHAPHRTLTATQLAKLADVQGDWRFVNLQYGRLGHMFCDATGFEPDRREGGGHRWWSVWSSGYSTPEGFMWEMLPQVAEALEILGWVSPGEMQIPEEVPAVSRLVEGATQRVTVNAYERNRDARRECIKHYGTSCAVCEIDLGAVYGPIAQGFIHIHHLKPLSEIGEEYEVDPITDLRPVCPNCHAVIHLGSQTRPIEEVKRLMREAEMIRRTDF